MAKGVVAQVMGGGAPKSMPETVNTVADVAREMGTTEGYTATINGEPASLSDSVDAYNVVHFSKAVKGGC